MAGMRLGFVFIINWCLVYSNPRIICEFLTFSPQVGGGLMWGKKFTIPARIAIDNCLTRP